MLPTCIIKINQQYVNIPYMDGMGWDMNKLKPHVIDQQNRYHVLAGAHHCGRRSTGALAHGEKLCGVVGGRLYQTGKPQKRHVCGGVGAEFKHVIYNMTGVREISFRLVHRFHSQTALTVGFSVPDFAIMLSACSGCT